MLTHNEYGGAQGGYPVMAGGGGFLGGEGGILGLIALLALFRGNLFGGNYDGARNNVGEIENQLANVRADLGDVKYNSARDILSQTNAILIEMCNGKFQNAEQVWNLGAKLGAEIGGVEKSVLIQGFQNQLANCEQTHTLSKQIADCCCETNLNMTRLNYEAMLREKDCCCETQKQFEEVKALIKNTALETELFNLRKESDRGFIRDEIRRSTAAGVNATFDSWWAAKTFNGATYPQPPFFYSQPAV